MTEVHVVYGPPLSGKTTYVKQRLKHNDLVFDYDDVMQALTGLKYQTHNSNMHQLVMDIRTKVLNDKAADNVYIITTFISKDLARQLNDVRHELVMMSTDYLTCIERLEVSDRDNKDDIRMSIIEWFNVYYNRGIMQEQYGTDKNKARFYTSRKWYGPTGLRQRALERDNYECQVCKRNGKITIDSIKQDGMKKKPTLNVHHVMEIEYYPEHALNLDNLITLCIPCHNRIHNKQDYQFRKKSNKWAEDEMW